MDTTLAKTMGDIFSIAALIPTLLFTLIYGVGSAWYKSNLGRVLFGIMATLSILLILVVLEPLLSQHLFYLPFILSMYGILVLALWAFFVIFMKEKARAPELVIPTGKDVSHEEVR